MNLHSPYHHHGCMALAHHSFSAAAGSRAHLVARSKAAWFCAASAAGCCGVCPNLLPPLPLLPQMTMTLGSIWFLIGVGLTSGAVHIGELARVRGRQPAGCSLGGCSFPKLPGVPSLMGAEQCTLGVLVMFENGMRAVAVSATCSHAGGGPPVPGLWHW